MTPPRPSGRLLLVPNALDLGDEPQDLRELLAPGVLRSAAALRCWVAENAKTTRVFLKRVAAIVPLTYPLQQIEIRELPRPAKGSATAALPAAAWHELLGPALAGEDLGLISEAGLPAVADPGAALVAAAHAAGVPVLPLPGPSALLLALGASGLAGQSFAFVGYLPQDGVALAARLRELQARSQRERQTQIAIETPYRNTALMQALLAHLAPETRLAVACALTLPGGWCRCLSVRDWRHAPPTIERRPAVFLFQA